MSSVFGDLAAWQIAKGRRIESCQEPQEVVAS